MSRYNTSKIPVVCEGCGSIALTDQIGFSGTAFIAGNRFVDACPECSGDMYTIDGTYRAIDGVVELLQSPEADVQEVNELLRILREAEDENWSEEEIRTAVNQRASSFSWVLQLIPDNPKWRTLLFFVLSIAITVSINEYRSEQDEDREQRQHEEVLEKMDELSRKVEEACGISEESQERLRRIIQERVDSRSTSVDEDEER